MADPVNHPSHYNKGGIETIDYMRTRCTPDEFRGYLRCSVMKYVDRAPDKGKKLEDYRKANWYLSLLISELEKEGDFSVLPPVSVLPNIS